MSFIFLDKNTVHFFIHLSHVLGIESQVKDKSSTIKFPQSDRQLLLDGSQCTLQKRSTIC